jgi:hypothetical protein
MSGVFDVTQLNLIRDVHVDWCAANSVEPKSVLGEEAVAYLLQAFSSGCESADDMMATLDRHIAERARHVQLGSPAIPSSSGEFSKENH